MTPHAIAVVELEATSASCFTRLVNIVNVFPRYLRNILFAAHALCTGDQIRFTNPSHAFPFLLCEVGLPSCTCYRFIDCKVFPSDVFTPLAASSRSRSWCNKAHIKSEGPKARQTSRKTAMYRLFSWKESFCAYHRVLQSCAGSVRSPGLCRSSIAVDHLRQDGALTRLHTRTYGITSSSDGFCRCSCITV